MRFWIILFLGFYFVSAQAQDRIIKREIEYDPDIDQTLKIISTRKDTIFYTSNDKPYKIATKDVIAFKKNYKESKQKYHFPKQSDQRIYGIRNDIVYFKADYSFNPADPELARECFLEKFRIYDSIVFENLKTDLYLQSSIIDEKVKIPHNVSFYIFPKGDELQRKFKARLYYTSSDTTKLIVKIEAGNEDRIYCFRNNEIEALSIESTGAMVGRLAVHVMSHGHAVQYSKDRWLTKYEFTEWHISK